MGTVEKQLSPQHRLNWITNHPNYTNATSKNVRTMNNVHEIVKWVEEHTVGDSTAELQSGTIKETVKMKWYFDIKSDAVLFKLIWGGNI